MTRVGLQRHKKKQTFRRKPAVSVFTVQIKAIGCSEMFLLRWGHSAPGQHVHSAQTPEEKNFWASLSDSVRPELELVQMLV